MRKRAHISSSGLTCAHFINFGEAGNKLLVRSGEYVYCAHAYMLWTEPHLESLCWTRGAERFVPLHRFPKILLRSEIMYSLKLYYLLYG